MTLINKEKKKKKKDVGRSRQKCRPSVGPFFSFFLQFYWLTNQIKLISDRWYDQKANAKSRRPVNSFVKCYFASIVLYLSMYQNRNLSLSLSVSSFFLSQYLFLKSLFESLRAERSCDSDHQRWRLGRKKWRQ